MNLKDTLVERDGPEAVSEYLSDSKRRFRHPIRWITAVLLLGLVVVAIVVATRTPQEASALESPLVGREAPRFSGVDLLGGAHVSLSEFKGRYVFINFFASWCPPCQQEAPNLVTFAYEQQHVFGGAALISVVFHDEDSSARQFMVSQGANWPVLPDPGGKIADSYGVGGPPMTFLVDPNGKITVQPLTGPATSQQLTAMLIAARSTNA